MDVYRFFFKINQQVRQSSLPSRFPLPASGFVLRWPLEFSQVSTAAENAPDRLGPAQSETRCSASDRAQLTCSWTLGTVPKHCWDARCLSWASLWVCEGSGCTHGKWIPTLPGLAPPAVPRASFHPFPAITKQGLADDGRHPRVKQPESIWKGFQSFVSSFCSFSKATEQGT